jgi:phosphoglycolate phosphatase
MNYKGIIFDLDGTLVNSLEDLADSMNVVLESFNFPTHELSAYKYLVGNGIRNLVRKALPDGSIDEALIDKCYDSMINIYRENCVIKTKTYDGIIELLNELNLRDIKLAVFSNKADELTKKIVMTLLPNFDFEIIMGLSAEEHKKPNPYGALLISDKFGVIPKDIIYVGDSGTDMQTANNAGMTAAGALWGFRTKAELISNGAKFILNTPKDLIQILES